MTLVGDSCALLPLSSQNKFIHTIILAMMAFEPGRLSDAALCAIDLRFLFSHLRSVLDTVKFRML